MDPNKAFRLLKKQPRPDPDGHLLNNAEYIEDWLIDGRCPSCGAIIEKHFGGYYDWPGLDMFLTS